MMKNRTDESKSIAKQTNKAKVLIIYIIDIYNIILQNII